MNNTPETFFASGTKFMYDSFSSSPIEVLAVEVDAAIGFFTSRGFEIDAAQVSALSVIKKAKQEGKSVMAVLESLTNKDQVTISNTVAQILNQNRKLTSVLGYKVSEDISRNLKRNIRP